MPQPSRIVRMSDGYLVQVQDREGRWFSVTAAPLTFEDAVEYRGIHLIG